MVDYKFVIKYENPIQVVIINIEDPNGATLVTSNFKLVASPTTFSNTLSKFENRNYFFLIYKYQDGEYFVKNKDNRFLSQNGTLEVYDGSLDQIMEFEVNGYESGSFTFKNSSGQYLDFDIQFVSSQLSMSTYVLNKNGISNINFNCFWVDANCP